MRVLHGLRHHLRRPRGARREENLHQVRAVSPPRLQRFREGRVLGLQVLQGYPSVSVDEVRFKLFVSATTRDEDLVVEVLAVSLGLDLE